MIIVISLILSFKITNFIFLNYYIEYFILTYMNYLLFEYFISLIFNLCLRHVILEDNYLIFYKY